MNHLHFDAKYMHLSLELFENIRRLSFDGEGVTRDGYSEMETQCINLIVELAKTRNLVVSKDRVGNFVITLLGADERAIVGTGSHMDTVPVV
jgi:N-carbamoyl-L-amino-acid hydrolase